MQVIFNHGKESGPWGTKIQALATQAKTQGMDTHSLDYQGVDDPDERVDQLLTYIQSLEEPFVLVGSSMGGYVATVAAAQSSCVGLFLMAPAFYLGGRANFDEVTPACHIDIVHGWQDAIVPVENSWRFARRTYAGLHLVDDDHRLINSLDTTTVLFEHFIESLKRRPV